MRINFFQGSHKMRKGILKKILAGAFAAVLMATFVPEMHVKAADYPNLHSANSFMYNVLEFGITPGPLNENGLWVLKKVYGEGNEAVPFKHYEYTYNENGKLTYFVMYDASGSVRQYNIDEYDAAEKEKKETGFFADGSIYYSRVIRYDSEDNQIEYAYYNADGSLYSQTINEYDNNRIVKTVLTNQYGVQTQEYEYDADGNYIMYVYDADGNTTRYHVCECNPDGSLSKCVFYNPDGEVLAYTELEYDNKGKLVKEAGENGGTPDGAEYVYDDKGNEIYASFHNSMGGGGQRTCKYEYDESGKKVKQIISFYALQADTATDDPWYVEEYDWEWIQTSYSTKDSELSEMISALPDEEAVTVDCSENSEVSADVFSAIAGTKKEVTFTSEGISWEFSGSDIDASAAKKINLSTTITKISQQDPNTVGAIENLLGKESNALVLKFAENGKLPGKAKIRVNADGALKEYLGTTGLDVYYWDSENNKLVSIASGVSINENNEIVFEIDHCSYYVVKGRETTKEDKHIPEDANKDVPVGYEMLFRLYNPNSGEHFYTTSKKEGDKLIDLGWNYEGEGWTAPTEGDPVYRLYNKNAGDHHYTTSKKERDKLISAGWTDEGIGWYSESKDTGKPLYRLYNPNATGAGSHHYTTSSHERDKLIKQGWNYEDIAWYGLVD